jgi:short-subunit dehydrogenase
MHTHTALVTGASAGIGACFARHLAAQGCNLLLVARRRERLAELAQELRAAHGIRCEVFAADLTEPDAPRAILEFAAKEQLLIDVLINNAGLSNKESFADTPWEKHAGDLQVMVTAVTELAHRVLPAMRAQGWGRIVNLSSIAAFSPPGESLLYTAIKQYVLTMSQSLDMELKPQGIHVTALCPGFTYSEFHDVMGTREKANDLPGVLWQQPEEVVREGWDAVMAGRPVCVPGTVNKVVASALRPLPVRLQYFLGKTLNPFKE